MWKNQDWLNAGGAEIVLEVVRRMGWTVDVVSAEEWEFLTNIVAVGDREGHIVSVNGGIIPWFQAIATVAITVSHFKNALEYSHKEHIMPFFHNGEWLTADVVHEIDRFIDRVRYSSEATISLVGAMSRP